MGSMNSVTLIGRLGADPELKYTPSNKAVCNLRLATSEFYKDASGARQEKTEWHNVTVWDKAAEGCGKFLSKGSECAVTGRLQTRQWDDKDGNKRYTTEVVADRVIFIGSGKGKKSEDEGLPF